MDTATEVVEELKTVIPDVKDQCPAFKEGCPFDKPELKEFREEFKKCPEFKEGCPFKEARSMKEVYDELAKMPHVEEGSPHQQALHKLLAYIHSVSKELKGQVGECPVFASKDGCPFKSVCSDGVPLIEKLDKLVLANILKDSVDQIKDDLQKKTVKQEEIELSKELKDGTKKVHREAERVHFIREFMKGRVEQTVYRRMVASLYHIYSAIEKESEKHSSHPLFSAVHFPKELNRVETLKADLIYYYGKEWEDEIEVSDATKEYVDHVHKVANEDPALLIAHHYSRYLGDLSGGQILKKMAVKMFDLPESGEGANFYQFDNVSDAREFKDMYRSRLDSLELSREQADKIVEEARVSFLLNIKLFKELDEISGFVEEVVHEQVEIVGEEAVASQEGEKSSQQKQEKEEKAVPRENVGDQKTTNEVHRKESPDWLRIVAVAALMLAVLFGFIIKMTDRY